MEKKEWEKVRTQSKGATKSLSNVDSVGSVVNDVNDVDVNDDDDVDRRHD